MYDFTTIMTQVQSRGGFPVCGSVLHAGFGIQRQVFCPKAFFCLLFCLASTHLQDQHSNDKKKAEYDERNDDPCDRFALRSGFCISYMDKQANKDILHITHQPHNGAHIQRGADLVERHSRSNILTSLLRLSSSHETGTEATPPPRRKTRRYPPESALTPSGCSCCAAGG